MVQFFQGREQQPSPSQAALTGLGTGFLQGASATLGQKLQELQQVRQNRQGLSALEGLYTKLGGDKEGWKKILDEAPDPNLLMNVLKIGATQQIAQQKQQNVIGKKDQESLQFLTSSQDAIRRMYELSDAAGVGKSGFISRELFDESRRNAGQFEALRTSLLGVAQLGILPKGIRNRQEFEEVLNGFTPKVNDSVERIRGKLKAGQQFLDSYISQLPQNTQERFRQEHPPASIPQEKAPEIKRDFSSPPKGTVRLYKKGDPHPFDVPKEQVEELKVKGGLSETP